MGDASLMTNLIKQIDDVARMQHAVRVVTVKVKLGSMATMTTNRFRERFAERSRGTIAEGAQLDIEEVADWSDPHAQDVILDRVDFEK
jgi:Zn finger protein HypA/HybF involved in hydrogenase expression